MQEALGLEAAKKECLDSSLIEEYNLLKGVALETPREGYKESAMVSDKAARLVRFILFFPRT